MPAGTPVPPMERLGFADLARTFGSPLRSATAMLAASVSSLADLRSAQVWGPMTTCLRLTGSQPATG
jgi:hypothetical protein